MQQTLPNLLQRLPNDPRYKVQSPAGVQIPASPFADVQVPNVSSGLCLGIGVVTLIIRLVELTIRRAWGLLTKPKPTKIHVPWIKPCEMLKFLDIIYLSILESKLVVAKFLRDNQLMLSTENRSCLTKD